MHAHCILILFSVVKLLTPEVESAIVKDASLTNIALQISRKSTPSIQNQTEFLPNDVLFIDEKPRRCFEVVEDLSKLQDARNIKIDSKAGVQDLNQFSQSVSNGAFKLLQNNHPLTLMEIAQLLHAREINYIRPTMMNIEGNNMAINQVIDIYAKDLKPLITVRYIYNDEVFFYDNERIGATQLYNIIFQRPNDVFDFSQIQINNMKLPFSQILHCIAFMKDLKIINEDKKYSTFEFLQKYPNFHGKVQLQYENVIDNLIDVVKKTLKYSVVDFFTLPSGIIHPYYVLKSLQDLPGLTAWRPGPGHQPKPIHNFLSNVFPDEDPKQNIIQVFYNNKLLSIQEIIELLKTKGHIIFGDMWYAERLPTNGQYAIKMGNHTYSVEAFMETYGRTSEYYEIIEKNRALTMEEIMKLMNTSSNTTSMESHKLLSMASMFGVSFSPPEVAFNLAQQKPRHVMISHRNKTYTPSQFTEIFRNHIPADFTVLQNGVEVSRNDIFNIIDINATPQFLEAFKVMNLPHKGQIYTKDDILIAILENPEGFTILDKGQFRTPLNFKEHYGDNVPGYVIYYKDKPIKPADLTDILDLEGILEEEFYPILYNGNNYSPNDVVRMLYNQQPDKAKILHKEKQYTPEEYLDSFPSTKFQVLYNDYPIKAQDLEQIIDFDLKYPKSTLRFYPIKYKGVTYTKDTLLDILIKQAPPNVKILHEGVFYLPKQFKRHFGNNIPANFAVVQDRRIIPSKLLPTIVRLGDSKQTNPKIFPNLFYGGKEYTPDDILHLIITQNPPDVTIAIRNQKYTPEQFEKLYDGVYPITFSILFKNMVIAPEEIINLVDFDVEPTEAPKLVIFTTQRGQKWMPTTTELSTTAETNEDISDDYKDVRRVRYVEEADIGSQQNENIPNWLNDYPAQNNIPVEAIEPNQHVESEQFPYVIHNGALFTPVDVVKSLIANISKISTHKWSIHHKGIEYIPSEFLKKFEILPNNFQIYRDDTEIKPENIANYVKLTNFGFTINEETDGKVFPHLVYNGVIYSPQDILHCLIQRAPEDTFIVHNNRTYQPVHFKEKFQNETVPHFNVVVRNETIPIEKLPDIVPLEEEPTFMPTYPSYIDSKNDEDLITTMEPTELTFVDMPTEPTLPTFDVSAGEPEFTHPVTEIPPIIATVHTPVTQFPYIIYNGSIFSPLEVVKLLKEQHPTDVTIVADNQVYNTEDFYDRYITDAPENFEIYDRGEYVPPAEVPKLISFDESIYGRYDYDYEESSHSSTPPLHTKPTITLDDVKKILNDNPNTRVVVDDKEYEAGEINEVTFNRIVDAPGLTVVRDTPYGYNGNSALVTSHGNIHLTSGYTDSLRVPYPSATKPTTEVKFPVDVPTHVPVTPGKSITDYVPILVSGEGFDKTPTSPVEDYYGNPHTLTTTSTAKTLEEDDDLKIPTRPSNIVPTMPTKPIRHVEYPSPPQSIPTMATKPTRPTRFRPDTLEETDQSSIPVYVDSPTKPRTPIQISDIQKPTPPSVYLPNIPERPSLPFYERDQPSKPSVEMPDMPEKPSQSNEYVEIPTEPTTPSIRVVNFEEHKPPSLYRPDVPEKPRRPNQYYEGETSPLIPFYERDQPTRPSIEMPGIPERPSQPNEYVDVPSEPTKPSIRTVNYEEPTPPSVHKPNIPERPRRPNQYYEGETSPLIPFYERDQPTRPSIAMPGIPEKPSQPNKYGDVPTEPTKPSIRTVNYEEPTSPLVHIPDIPERPRRPDQYQEIPTNPSSQFYEIDQPTRPSIEIPGIPEKPSQPNEYVDVPTEPTKPSIRTVNYEEPTPPSVYIPNIPERPRRPNQYYEGETSPLIPFYEREPTRPSIEMPGIPKQPSQPNEYGDVPTEPTKPSIRTVNYEEPTPPSVHIPDIPERPRRPNQYYEGETSPLIPFYERDQPTRPSIEMPGIPERPSQPDEYVDVPTEPTKPSIRTVNYEEPTPPSVHMPNIPERPRRPNQYYEGETSPSIPFYERDQPNRPSIEMPGIPDKPSKPDVNIRVPTNPTRPSLEIINVQKPTPPSINLPGIPEKPTWPNQHYEVPRKPSTPYYETDMDINVPTKQTRPPFEIINNQKPTPPLNYIPDIPENPERSVQYYEEPTNPSFPYYEMEQPTKPSILITGIPEKPSRPDVNVGVPPKPTRPSHEIINIQKPTPPSINLPGIPEKPRWPNQYHEVPEEPSTPYYEMEQPTRPSIIIPDIPEKPSKPDVNIGVPTKPTRPTFEEINTQKPTPPSRYLPDIPEKPSWPIQYHEVPTRPSLEIPEKPSRYPDVNINIPTKQTRPPFEIINNQKPTPPSNYIPDIPENPERSVQYYEEPTNPSFPYYEMEQPTKPSILISEIPEKPSEPDVNIGVPTKPTRPSLEIINIQKPTPEKPRWPGQYHEVPEEPSTPYYEMEQPTRPSIIIPGIPEKPSKPTPPSKYRPDIPEKPRWPNQYYEVPTRPSTPYYETEYPTIPSMEIPEKPSGYPGMNINVPTKPTRPSLEIINNQKPTPPSNYFPDIPENPERSVQYYEEPTNPSFPYYEIEQPTKPSIIISGIPEKPPRPDVNVGVPTKPTRPSLEIINIQKPTPPPKYLPDIPEKPRWPGQYHEVPGKPSTPYYEMEQPTRPSIIIPDIPEKPSKPMPPSKYRPDIPEKPRWPNQYYEVPTRPSTPYYETEYPTIPSLEIPEEPSGYPDMNINVPTKPTRPSLEIINNQKPTPPLNYIPDIPENPERSVQYYEEPTHPSVPYYEMEQPTKPSIIINGVPEKPSKPDVNIGVPTKPTPPSKYLPDIPEKPRWPSQYHEVPEEPSTPYYEMEQPTRPSIIIPDIPEKPSKPTPPSMYRPDIPEKPRWPVQYHEIPTRPSTPHYETGYPTVPSFDISEEPSNPVMTDIQDNSESPERSVQYYEVPTKPSVPYYELEQPTRPSIIISGIPEKPTKPSENIHIPTKPTKPSVEIINIGKPTPPSKYMPDFPEKPSRPDQYDKIPVKPSIPYYDVQQPTRPSIIIPDIPEKPLQPNVNINVPTKPTRPSIYMPDTPENPRTPNQYHETPTSPSIPYYEMEQPTRPSIIISGIPEKPSKPTRPSVEIIGKPTPPSMHKPDIPDKPRQPDMYQELPTKPTYPYYDIEQPTRPSIIIPDIPEEPWQPEEDHEIPTVPSNTFPEIDQPSKPSVIIPDIPERPTQPDVYFNIPTKPTRPSIETLDLIQPTMPSMHIPDTPEKPRQPDEYYQVPTIPSIPTFNINQPTKPSMYIPGIPEKPTKPDRYTDLPTRPTKPSFNPINIETPTQISIFIPNVPTKPEQPDEYHPGTPTKPTKPSIPYFDIQQPTPPSRYTPKIPENIRQPDEYYEVPRKPIYDHEQPSRPSIIKPDITKEPGQPDMSTDIPAIPTSSIEEMFGYHTEPSYMELDHQQPTQPSDLPYKPKYPIVSEDKPTMPSMPITDVQHPTKPSFYIPDIPRQPTKPTPPSILIPGIPDQPTKPAISVEIPTRPTRPSIPNFVDQFTQSSVPIPSISENPSIYEEPSIYKPDTIRYEQPTRSSIYTLDISEKPKQEEDSREASTIPTYSSELTPERPEYSEEVGDIFTQVTTPTPPSIYIPGISEKPIPPGIPEKPVMSGEIPTKPTKPSISIGEEQQPTVVIPGYPEKPKQPYESIEIPAIPTKPSIPTYENYWQPTPPSAYIPDMPEKPTYPDFPRERPTIPSRPSIPEVPKMTEYPYINRSPEISIELPSENTSQDNRPNPNEEDLIIDKGKVYDNIDIIRELALDNQVDDVKIIYTGQQYTPDEFIQKFSNAPDNVHVIFTIDGEPAAPSDIVKSKIPPATEKPPSKIFPNVIQDGVEFTPKDVIHELAKDPEGQCIAVVYDGQLYTPWEFYKKFSNATLFPKNFQMQVSGHILDPKVFLSVFKILDKVDKVQPYKKSDASSLSDQRPKQNPGTIVRTFINKALAKEPNFQIVYSNRTYHPLEYVKVMGEYPPGNFQILYENELQTPKTFYKHLKERQRNMRPISKPFPHVSFNNEDYGPRLVLESLAISNPNNVKVRVDRDDYSPMQVIASFDKIPEEFELIDKYGQMINPMEPWKYLGNVEPSGRKSIGVDREKFPVLVSHGVKYQPYDVLRNIVYSKANIQVQLINGRTISALQALSIRPFTDEFSLVSNGVKLQPSAVARMIKLQQI